MLRFPMIVRWTGCIVLAWATACAPREAPVSKPVARAWESPDPPPVSPPAEPGPGSTSKPANDAGADVTAPGKVIAVVNGTPIYRKRFVDNLLESHGLRLLEQMILLTAARRRAADMSLTVTRADVQAAHDDALRRLASPVGDPGGQALSREQAGRLLSEFLAAKNISRSEWDCRMEQRACLRKIAESMVAQTEVTEEMIRKEYELAYGEKVQVRHIQVSSLAAVARARALLAENKDFELVARQISENEFTAARGGLTRPFTRDDRGVTPLLRQAAFELKVGEISQSVRDGNAYHIIRLERRFPASDVGFENVDRHELRRRLVERLIEQQQPALETELFREAAVDIRNEDLERQFREKHRR